MVPTMKTWTPAAVLLSLVLGSCSEHPLHGGWKEQTQGTPRVLEFDPKSDQLMVHMHGRTDGGPDHMHGTWKEEGEVLRLQWEDGATKVALQGKRNGDTLQLTGPDGKAVEFVRGGSAH